MTSSSIGVASLHLGLGEIELSTIRERQAAGISIARKKGVYQGSKSGTTKGTLARASISRPQAQRGCFCLERFDQQRKTVFGCVIGPANDEQIS